MSTRECEVQVIQLLLALVVTSITAKARAGMIATLLGAGAWLQALDGIVENIRVAPANASMSTVKPLLTRQAAATLGREYHKVVWPGNHKWCVWVPRALQIQAGPEVSIRLEFADDISPHGNVAVGVRIADNVHAMLGARQ